MDRFTGNMNLNAGRSAIFPRGSSDDQDTETFDRILVALSVMDDRIQKQIILHEGYGRCYVYQTLPKLYVELGF